MSVVRFGNPHLLLAALLSLVAAITEPAAVGPDDAPRPIIDRPPTDAPPAGAPELTPVAVSVDAITAPALEVMIAEALARSPSVAALTARLAAAGEMIRPAGALPNPMVEGMLQDIGFPRITVGDEDMSMVGIEIRQGLPYPGKRSARRAAARAEVGIRGSELEQFRRGIVTEVRTTYARLYAIDREFEVLAAADDLLQLLATTVATRYSTGQADLEAVVKSQLNLTRLGERRDDRIAERSALVATLNRLRDRPATEPLGEVRQLPEPSPPAEPWAALAVSNSPEVAVANAALAATERRAEVTQLDRKPDLWAAAGIASRGSLDHVVTLRFGLELPFWRGDRQEPLVRAAQFEVAMAAAELQSAEAEVRFEAARLQADWQRAEAQIRRFRQALVPQSSLALDAARTAYENGGGDLRTVVEDFNLWLEARVELARREADRFATWAAIDGLVGGPTTTTDQGAAR